MQYEGPAARVEELQGHGRVKLARHGHGKTQPKVIQCSAFIGEVAVRNHITFHDVEHVHKALQHPFHVGHVAG